MNDAEQKILKRCYELQKTIAKSEPEKWEAFWHQEWLDKMKHGPPYKIGDWFGPLPERDRVRYRRCVQALERQGLLTTWRRWGDRITNVKLTTAGKDFAER